MYRRIDKSTDHRIKLISLLNVVQFHVRVHYAMELLRRMMDGFVSSGEHHEPSACIAGLPADEPSLFMASLSGPASLANR